ncbi:hypothetical protein BHM03_00056332, partial [Ensete ventricosum]
LYSICADEVGCRVASDLTTEGSAHPTRSVHPCGPCVLPWLRGVVNPPRGSVPLPVTDIFPWWALRKIDLTAISQSDDPKPSHLTRVRIRKHPIWVRVLGIG